EFTYGDYVAPSILEFTDNAIEFHSLSKTFCMTGDRIGFAVGRKEYVD
ncbi:aspartate aminotransferase, partial [Candidatus Micrarchaeota archaeon CG_4_10_14_0_2_um_filter_49_7]